MTANYRDIAKAIEDIAPWNHGSSHATVTDTPDGYVLEVYSYSTLMLRVDTGSVTYWNPAKYSSTTSRLQNMLLARWGRKIEGVRV